MEFKNSSITTHDCADNTALKVIHIVIGVLAIGTNAAILFVHYRFETVRNPLHLIPAVAASDLLMGIAQFVQVHIFSACDYVFTRLQCFLLLQPFLIATNTNASFMLMLSVYRLLCYKRPMRAKVLGKGRFAMAAYGIGLGYTAAGIVAHAFVVPLKGNLRVCSVQASVGVFVTGRYVLACLMVLSIGIMLVNIWLHFEVRGQVKKVSDIATQGAAWGQAAALRDVRVAQSTVIISAIYVATWFASIALRNVVVRIEDQAVKASLGPYITVLMSVNSVTNFFVYISRGSEYRHALGLGLSGIPSSQAQT